MKIPNKSPLPTGISTTNSNQQRSIRAGGRAPRSAIMKAINWIRIGLSLTMCNILCDCRRSQEGGKATEIGQKSLPENYLLDNAPKTARRVDSITKVPDDIKSAFFESLDDSRIFDQSVDLTPDQREGFKRQMAARARIIKDRDEDWGGGCLAGNHFLEAGETETGWWIFYEGGGIINWSSLVIIERINGQPKVVAVHQLGPFDGHASPEKPNKSP